MYYFLLYPMFGLVFGLIACAVVRPLFRQKWPVFLVALMAPIPFVYVLAAFGLAFMRDDSITVGSLVSLIGFIVLLVWPGSLLAACLICRERVRRR